jgi:hypothetical protein
MAFDPLEYDLLKFAVVKRNERSLAARKRKRVYEDKFRISDWGFSVFEELKETFKKFPDLNRVMKPSEQKVAKQQENEIKNKERREARDQVDLDEVVAALNNGEELDEVFAGLNDGEFTFMIDRESDQILNQCFCSILKATSQKACCSY